VQNKKILFQIFNSLLLYKWNFKNGKCFVTLFVSAVGGAGGWNSWLGIVWTAHSHMTVVKIARKKDELNNKSLSPFQNKGDLQFVECCVNGQRDATTWI
jgi:hypothetical protein